MSTNNLPGSDPEGTIPVATAIELTANWRTYLKTSEEAFHIQSFLIPIINFKNILLYNPDAEGVRAYIGLESATDPKSAKLVLVPVVDGHDVPHLPGGGNNIDGTTNSEISNAYDLNPPCPPQCPVDSVFNR
jgi:hypothetical protein